MLLAIIVVVLIPGSIKSQDTLLSNCKSDTSCILWTQELTIKEIPDYVFKKSNLKHLEIYGLECCLRNVPCWLIKEIPPSIRLLSKLESLVISVQAIKKLPDDLKELKSLKILAINDTYIEDITVISQLRSLEGLYLFGCGLKTLPNDLSNLRNLRILGLTGNSISPEELDRLKISLPNCRIIYKQ